MIKFIKKKPDWIRIRLSLNAVCLAGAILYYMYPRQSMEDTFIMNPLPMILIEPLLSYCLFLFGGIALFRYCLEYTGNSRLKKMGKLKNIIVIAYFMWMTATVILCLSGIFEHNELIYRFFRTSYSYMKSELNCHVIAALAVVDALDIVNRSKQRQKTASLEKGDKLCC